jgi:anti-sigma regulatory factor (Ser/Thr protein kinase)
MGGGQAPGGDSSVTLELPVTNEAARQARARLAATGAGWQLDEKLWDSLLLIISEAVSNASRRSHAAPDDERAVIRLAVTEDAVRGEVRDGRLGFDVPLEAFLQEGVAASLYVIDHVSDAWGLEFTDGAKLWFELLRRPSGPQRRPASASSRAPRGTR